MSSNLREALREIYTIAEDCYISDETALDRIRTIALTALAEPPRNCEVGTPEEQAKRFREYCRNGDCKRTVCNSYGYEALFHYKCFPIWARLPYGKRQPLSRPAGAGLTQQPKKENDNGKDA